MSTPNSTPPHRTQKVSSKTPPARDDTPWIYEVLIGFAFGYGFVWGLHALGSVFAR